MTPTADLMKLVENHIADLRRCAVLLDRYTQLRATAAEIRKAADELQAALSSTGEARVGVEVDSNTLRKLREARQDATGLRLLVDKLTRERDEALATPAQPKASEGEVIERGVRIMEAMPKLQELLDYRRYGEGDEPLLVTVGTDLIDAVMYEVRDQLGGLASEGKAGGEDGESVAERLVNDFEDAIMRRYQQFCPAVERAVTSRPHRDAISARAALIATLTAPGADDGQ